VPRLRARPLYRYGGEEFLVLLPEQPLEEATHAMNRVLVGVEQLAIPAPDKPDVLTIRVGVAHLDPLMISRWRTGSDGPMPRRSAQSHRDETVSRMTKPQGGVGFAAAVEAMGNAGGLRRAAPDHARVRAVIAARGAESESTVSPLETVEGGRPIEERVSARRGRATSLWSRTKRIEGRSRSLPHAQTLSSTSSPQIVDVPTAPSPR
jgi:hypothetical protein